MSEKKTFIYSVPITQKKQGQTPIFRHPLAKYALKIPPRNINNMQMVWRQCVTFFKNKRFLEQFTYLEIDRFSAAFGSWLSRNNHKIFYFYTKNRWQWTVSDIACFRYGSVSVPLYDTLGKQAIDHIVKLTEGRAILCQTETLKSLVNSKFLFNQNNLIKTVVIVEPISNQITKILQENNIQIVNFMDILKNKQYLLEPIIKPQDHLTYCFTSGTTGLPKGVITTHWNSASQLYSLDGIVSQINQGDVHLSYLPLPHIYERFELYFQMRAGGQVRYYSGSTQQIVKDFMRVRPHRLPLVPRLLNLFYAGLREFKHVDKKLAQQAWKVKKENWQKGIYTSPYDDTVFKPTVQMFGGRLKSILTGSAPISTQILDFFRIVLGIDIREGYGQTQTTSKTFTVAKNDFQAGHVGGPNLSIEFKLVDIPEMNYSSQNIPPTGQICMRGHVVFAGYFKDEKNTKQTIDEQGWHHSGDVGMVLPNGALKIIDRKKNIYKLSQGQYIAPEKIENIYNRNHAIAQAFVYGDSLQSYNIAFLLPKKQYLQKYAESIGLKQSFQDLCKNPQIVAHYLTLITEQGKKDGLKGFEMAKKLKLLSRSLMTYGVLTNTLKLQRHLAKKVFKAEIEQLYK